MTQQRHEPRTPASAPDRVLLLRATIFWWGIAGPAGMLCRAVWRLGPQAWSALAAQHALSMTALLVLTMSAMAWAEGYRGFQQRVVPRVIARAQSIADSGSTLQRVLAPLVAADLLLVDRKALIRRWCLVIAIVLLITVTRLFPPPIRSVIQCGVFAGLGWGLVSLLLLSCQHRARLREPAAARAGVVFD